MNAIAIVDTSIVCELLGVPGKTQEALAITELKTKVGAGEALFLPMAAVLETGNHIGQVADGGSRRACAVGLVTLVESALSGTSPFVALGFWDKARLREWISEFPKWASSGSGLGDLSIKRDWDEQCALNPGRHVYIWSRDAHLRSFDRDATIK